MQSLHDIIGMQFQLHRTQKQSQTNTVMISLRFIEWCQ